MSPALPCRPSRPRPPRRRPAWRRTPGTAATRKVWRSLIPRTVAGSYGNENWEFDAEGLMRRRIASINDLPIAETDRKFHWPLGRRSDDHPGLSELGL